MSGSLTKLGCFLTFAVAITASKSLEAALITFDFEDEAATSLPRSGALSTLLITKSGLTIDIQRPGGSFDIVNNTGTQSKPANFALRSVDPFIQEQSGTPFIVNFSIPVQRVSVDMGDYGQDTPDVLQLKAFSGSDGTGTPLTAQTRFLPTLDPADPFDFKKLQVSASGSGALIRSIEMIGGTPAFPNSVFYDNLTASLPSLNSEADFLNGFDQLTSSFSAVDPVTPVKIEDLPTPFEILNDLRITSGQIVGQINQRLVIFDRPVLQVFLESLCDAAGGVCFSVDLESLPISSDAETNRFRINPVFEEFQFDISLDLDVAELELFSLGDQFLTSFPFFGNDMSFSTIEVASITNDLQTGTLGLKISGISAVHTVPEPPMLILFGINLCFAMLIATRRNRHDLGV